MNNPLIKTPTQKTETREKMLSLSVVVLSIMYIFQVPISFGSVVVALFMLLSPVVLPPFYDFMEGIGLVDGILGAILRPFVTRWLGWLEKTKAKDPDVKEPWLPTRLKKYYQRLGIALQFQKAQQESMQRNQQKKRQEKKKTTRGRRAS